MAEERQFYVYIMSSISRTLYVGVTNDLVRRVAEHKVMWSSSFTSRYHITHVVHYEIYDSINAAIAREKQIKGWLRAKKVALVESENPEWRDLSLDW